MCDGWCQRKVCRHEACSASSPVVWNVTLAAETVDKSELPLWRDIFSILVARCYNVKTLLCRTTCLVWYWNLSATSRLRRRNYPSTKYVDLYIRPAALVKMLVPVSFRVYFVSFYASAILNCRTRNVFCLTISHLSNSWTWCFDNEWSDFSS